MAKIKVIEEEQATGRLKEIYDNLLNSRGKLASVHKIQSLRPESIVKHMDLYMEIMYSKSKLSRAERELVAVIVSISNKCDYCQTHHSEALNKYWKNDGKINQLLINYKNVDLTEKEAKLCDFAQLLTITPSLSTDTKYINELKQIGLEDEAILDLVLVIAYFNFVNRIVLSLDVQLEENTEGYKY